MLQMLQGFEIQFSFFEGQVGLNAIAIDPILVLEFYLKASFLGQVLQKNSTNHYGPLHVEWMDDPTHCRENEFSEYAPAAPIQDPVVVTNTSMFNALLYCSGDEYLPLPLPQTRSPTQAPSSSPSLSVAPSDMPTLSPTSFPSANPTHSPTKTPTQLPTVGPTLSPTFSSVALRQLEALANFYNSTQMFSSYSSALQNWFINKDYCRFTGISCDSIGYVTGIDLNNKGLAGTLPQTWDNLNRINKLRVTGNLIAGPIPTHLYELDSLNTIEIANNRFTGEIPRDFRFLKNLRRLVLSYNKLNGTIPSELCEMTRLSAFQISNNVDMTGEIPPCFGGLPLDLFSIQNVGLVGTVPASLCGIRSMNGLFPNRFGCDALACPTGTYGITNGRMVDNLSPCVACTVPSNVLASTSCVFLEGNTVGTPTPTTTFFPNVFPTPLPTLAPSVLFLNSSAPVLSPTISTNTTNNTTTPTGSPIDTASPAPSMLYIDIELTNSPTLMASQDTMYPSITVLTAPSSSPSTAPSSFPSNAPSAKATTTVTMMILETFQLDLIFVGVTSKLNDTTVFCDATKTFLENNSTTIKNVTVLSHNVGAYSNETVASIPIARYLKDRRALFVHVLIEGSVSDNGTLLEAVQARLVNFDAYAARVGLVKVSSTTLPITPPTLAPVSVSSRKKDLNWGLIGAAICLTVVAIVCVYIVRHKHQLQRLTEQAHFATSTDVRRSVVEDGMDNNDDFSLATSTGWKSTASLAKEEEDNNSLWDEWSCVDKNTKRPIGNDATTLEELL